MARPHAKNRGDVNTGLRAVAKKHWEASRLAAVKPIIAAVRDTIGNSDPAALIVRKRIIAALLERATVNNRDVRDIFADIMSEEWRRFQEDPQESVKCGLEVLDLIPSKGAMATA